MKKAETKYYSRLESTEYETLEVVINEEDEGDSIKISFNTDIFRTRENTKKVLEEIIKQIDTL
jgi:hypothetical protein